MCNWTTASGTKKIKFTQKADLSHPYQRDFFFLNLQIYRTVSTGFKKKSSRKYHTEILC